ncbi:hypothetical protein RD792_002114 [Penstemon davidsonii]|uniref:Alpha/beta hydrolase fold-3 domain-containing protein n=1 Tax=Penstemon davidsonii TaxID=160366 RepID=A0ABR0DQ73_9LAMI|nr:hypothetical protein RD792_002114 [Penstemon davidsonii]
MSSYIGYKQSSPITSIISTEIRHNFSPLLKVYKDGRVERLIGQGVAPASVHEETGVQSKDVDVVSTPKVKLSARLYLPKNATPAKKLPLLIFIHGGGFMVESAYSPQYHNHVNYLVGEANVVAVSINYRLAPEDPLPAAYEDSWLALKWVSENCDREEWIKNYADMGRVFLGGDSAGGNIAHHMGIRIGLEKLDGFNFRGIFLNCPYFWGEERIGNESSHHEEELNWCPGDLWRFVSPSSKDCDDPRINPRMDPNLSKLGCEKVLVYVGERDVFRDRGWYYKEALIKSGWDGDNIEVFEVEGEDHVSDVINPQTQSGIATIKKVAAFLNQ